MRAHAKAVAAFHGNRGDNVTKWDHECEMPQILDTVLVPANYFSGSGSTSPDTILRQPAAIESIRDSDLWVLITDGEIAEQNVAELARLADVMEVIHVPAVLLIFGGKYAFPGNTNISVGIPFFAAARAALILFKDYSTGRLYLMGLKEGLLHSRTKVSKVHSIDQAGNHFQNTQTKLLLSSVVGNWPLI